MNTKFEPDLWASSGVKAITEIDGFPFQSYDLFVQSVNEKKTSIGIEYGPARELSNITTSAFGKYWILFLSALPILFAIASLFVATYTKNWWICLGLITSISGQAVASPYNRYNIFGLILALALLIYFGLIQNAFGVYQWIALVYSISFLATRYMNRTAWKWARNAVLSSEALASHLYKSGNLHVRKNEVTELTTSNENMKVKLNPRETSEIEVGLLKCTTCQSKLYVNTRRFNKDVELLVCPKCKNLIHKKDVDAIQEVKIGKNELKEYEMAQSYKHRGPVK